MTRPITFAAALALVAAFPAHAQGPPPAAPQETPAVRRPAAPPKAAFFALQDEFDDATEAYRAKSTEVARQRRANPDDATLQPPPPPQPEFFPRFLALADEGSLDAELWVVQHHAYGPEQGDAARADKRTRMLRVLAASPTDEQLALLSRVASMDAGGSGALSKEEALAFLDIICASAKAPEVQAGAALYKASALDVRGGGRDERKAAIDAMKAVAARWPETKAGVRAGGKAFAFENLNIGQTAPEIVGQDVDGNALNLSDFAGRVVVLDFWGFW